MSPRKAGILPVNSERPIASDVSIPLRRLSSQIAANLRQTFAAHIPLYATSGLFFALSFALLAFYRVPMPLDSGLFFLQLVGELLLLWIPSLLAIDVYRLWRSGAPPGLVGILIKLTMSRLLKGDRIGNSVHALITLTPMMIAFTVIKENITAINPFSWDKTFAHWDLALALGHMPWQMLQSSLDHPIVTVVLNLFYHLWFFVMFGFLLWQGFSSRTNLLRMQFLLAFCFSWFFGGSILAIAFSSAGPCYYGNLFPGPSPFDAQTAYLNSIGPKWIWSLAVQRDLWVSYVTGDGVIKGISAMPSMHVTIAALNALLCWRIDRRLGIAATIFALMIFLGSIVLLWHYAVDGLAAFVIAGLCWLAAGAITQRWLDYIERWTRVPEAAALHSSQID